MCSFISIYAQDNIVFNKLRKLLPHETFTVDERIIVENETCYRFKINIKTEIGVENVLVFKETNSVYMFQDGKRLLVYCDTTSWNKTTTTFISSGWGDPLYYIDGNTGVIEYIGSSFGGFFILEEPMVFINRIPTTTNQVSTNLYVYGILEKRIISILDTTKYVQDKVKIEGQDYFDIGFVGGRNYSVPVHDGRIKIYFDHYGEDGPKSFFAYLNVMDINNLKIEDSIEPANGK